MPYIKDEDRSRIDPAVFVAVESLKGREFSETLGDLNYFFSMVLSKVMGGVSYSKIAMATGVLENVKQEFYRRAAAPYEDAKIRENGDISEYKKAP